MQWKKIKYFRLPVGKLVIVHQKSNNKALVGFAKRVEREGGGYNVYYANALGALGLVAPMSEERFNEVFKDGDWTLFIKP